MATPFRRAVLGLVAGLWLAAPWLGPHLGSPLGEALGESFGKTRSSGEARSEAAKKRLGRHALLEVASRLGHGPRRPTKLEEVLSRLDLQLEEDVELALWWPEREGAGLGALGHLWARAGYELAPRRVYPLLTPGEAARLEPLHDGMRPFLAQRGAALVHGDLDLPVAVLAWGAAPTCRLADFPRLVSVLRIAPGCLLRPPAQILDVEALDVEALDVQEAP